MTVKELFDFIKGVRPGFAFTDAQLTVWLNEIEGHVQTDIWLLEPAVDETQTGLVEYDSTIDPETGEMVDANHELLVPFPWNNLYRYFLLMSIDLANGEYQRYANSYELFNEAYEEYAGWYAQHVSPANGEAITRGYYISAYQFAARGGYAGTEKEFAEALGEYARSSEQVHADRIASEAAATAAGLSATSAQAHATTASQKANLAAQWATGSTTGTPTATNNSKHYADIARAYTGAPRTAATAADMSNADLIYVYVGTTTADLTNGHWYYHDGTDWVDGGVYNSTAFETDESLTIEGAAADAAVTGEVSRRALEAFPTVEAKGETITIPDGADDIPVSQCIVNVQAKMMGAGTPTPNNIRDINAVTSATITLTDDDAVVQETYTIAFKDGNNNDIPVYRGTLNVLTGELTVTHKYAELSAHVSSATTSLDPDGKNSHWATSGTKRYNYASANNDSQYKQINDEIKKAASNTTVSDIYSNQFTAATPNQTSTGDAGDYKISIATDGRIGVYHTSTRPNGDTFQTWMYGDPDQGVEGHPIKIGYPLATPETYYLTPAQVKTISGYNKFSCNCGSMDIVYRAKESALFPENTLWTRKAHALIRKASTVGKTVYSTMPKMSSKNVTAYYETDTPIKGIQYSSVWRSGQDVYRNLTFETFYSALANPASVLYTKDYTSIGISNAHTWYGGVCSSFVTWLIDYPYYASTDILARELSENVKQMDSFEDIEVGDLLNRVGQSGFDNHIMAVTQVYTDSTGHIVSVDVSEQKSPYFATTNYLFDDFVKYITEKKYTVVENQTGRVRYAQDSDFATDIIFERGNNTYVDLTEMDEMWFYIPSGDKVWIKKDGGNWTGYDLSGADTDTVNGVTVYDLAPLFDGVGSYELTTSDENKKYCHISVINVGTVTISNDVMTLAGYENCTPYWYYVVRVGKNQEGQTYDSAFGPLPGGYHASYTSTENEKRNYPVENDTVVLQDVPSWSGPCYKIWLEYETDCGYKYVLSDLVNK